MKTSSMCLGIFMKHELRGSGCREPLQYVVNCSDWRSYKLAVGPGVLIPRPETEVLLDLALQVPTSLSCVCCSPRNFACHAEKACD